MRKIVVCVKAVSDPKQERNIKIDPVIRNLIRGAVPLALNPLDKTALEAARQLKAHMDAHITAYTLARGIEKAGPFDLILCGRASSDGATEWVGPEIAAFLGIPVVTMVREIVDSDGNWWTQG